MLELIEQYRVESRTGSGSVGRGSWVKWVTIIGGSSGSWVKGVTHLTHLFRILQINSVKFAWMW